LESDCPFCKIFTGELQVNKVYEDENTVAIVDNNPRFSEGQCVVIHKRHVDQFYQLEDDELAGLSKAVKSVANKIKKAFNSRFVSTFTRGQSVPHVHVIIFPLSELDALSSYLESTQRLIQLIKKTDAKRLDEIARLIREA